MRVIADASVTVNNQPARSGEAVETLINLPADEAELTLRDIDFETRDLRPADFEQAETIVSFFQERDVIHGPIDRHTAMLDGSYKEHVG